MNLQAYVFRAVATRILAAGVVLIAVLQILDMLEVTPQIIERGLGFAGTLHYALLRLPRMIDQAAPLAVLAGAIFAFMKLAGDSEIVAMRASGVSAYRLLRMAVPAALAVVLVDIAAVEVVAPRTDSALETWWNGTAPPKAESSLKPKAFRVGQDLVIASTTDYTGKSLRDLRIYRRDGVGHTVERINAPRAVWTEGGWRLVTPSFARFGATGVSTGQAQAMEWGSAFRPVDVQALFFGDQTISAAMASRALSGGGAQRPQTYYATRLHRAVASPLGDLVMLLIAAPIALASFRSSRGAMFVTASLGAGLLFLVVDGVLAAMGESGFVTPVLAAWAAPLIAAALAGSVLIRLEG